MADFSIELAAETIVDPRSRQYFKEVYSSYANENYRSAVVMLWSVLICDLLFKVDELSATGDKAATSISVKIRDMQAVHPASPEWELSLLTEVSKTMLFDATELANLLHLQKHRHVSAHPVLNPSYELYAPSREVARSHIRNVLQSVLCKPALMSKKVFDAFVEDLENVKGILPDQRPGMSADVDLRRYLEAKYFARLPYTAAESLFKSLWRVTFKSADERSEANRLINLRALLLLFSRHRHPLLTRIATDSGCFSEISPAEPILTHLLIFLALEQRVYPTLTDAAHVLLNASASKSENGRSLAVFQHVTLSEHIAAVSKRREAAPGSYDLSLYVFAVLYNLAEDKHHDVEQQLVDFAIAHYVASRSFDSADTRFRLLRICAARMSRANAQVLLAGIEQNPQTYSRGRAELEHAELKKVIDEIEAAKFDYSSFPNFIKSIR